jgi:hypothetical protein
MVSSLYHIWKPGTPGNIHLNCTAIRHIENSPPHIYAVDVPFMRKCMSLIEHYWKFIKKNLTRCNNVSKFIIPYLYEAQRVSGDTPPIIRSLPKTALAAPGFSYVEGCWMCGWWMLLGTDVPTTSNHLPRMKNQRLPVQF